MRKINLTLTITYVLGLSLAQASELSDSNTQGPFTKQRAYMCIELNKELNLASQQMIATENSKSHTKSKILYLQDAIKERRDLIEELDQRNYQQNNDNYNKLYNQYESLVEEKKETVNLFNQQQALHTSQHNSVIRLEQRFSSQCLNQVEISQQLYNEVCELEKVRWCSAFNFD